MSVNFKNKKITKKSVLKSIIFLKIKANSAITGPPIGSTLGQYGIPAALFCKLFNDRTITIKNDSILNVSLFLTINGEYKFNISSPTYSFFFKKSLSLSKGVSKPGILKTFLFSKNSVIVSPYLIFEISLYKEMINFSINTNQKSMVKQLKGSLLSIGIHILNN